MSASASEELSANVQRLVELAKQIQSAREDMRVLQSAEKALKEQVKQSMVRQSIDTINLKKGSKIHVKTSKRKSGFNKKTAREGLMKYFQNDESKVDKAFECIDGCLEVKESTSLSITGLKEKAQE